MQYLIESPVLEEILPHLTSQLPFQFVAIYENLPFAPPSIITSLTSLTASWTALELHARFVQSWILMSRLRCVTSYLQLLYTVTKVLCRTSSFSQVLFCVPFFFLELLGCITTLIIVLVSVVDHIPSPKLADRKILVDMWLHVVTWLLKVKKIVIGRCDCNRQVTAQRK